MEVFQHLLSYNYVSAALIIGIIVMLIENRKERPHGTEYIHIIVIMLAIIVGNATMKEWFMTSVYDPYISYEDDAARSLMYLISSVEHILYPMIAYVELLVIAPVTKKKLIFIPELVVIISELVNDLGPKLIYSYDDSLVYHDGPLFLLPYFAAMIYLLLLLRYSIYFFREKDTKKGITVIFIVFLTLLTCYLEAAYFVVDVLDEVVAIDIMVYYFYLIAIYQSEIKIRLRTSELELEKSQRLLSLSQIQPHFMYNSLTSIIYLCDKDTEKTKNALMDFSKYLRKNLEAMSRSGLVSIKEELEHTKVYLSLEKLRFDEDLDVEFDIKDEMFMLPVLTVQPLVENAVKHGITGSESGCGTVSVSTEETDEFHKITIKDNGAGFETDILEHADESHVGIANVRKRLEDECGGQLIINSVPDEGTECIILVPKEKANENSGDR